MNRLKKLGLGCAVAAASLCASAAPVAGQSFTDTFDSIDAGWVTDRYEPNEFVSSSFDGGNRLKIGISTAQSAENRGGQNGAFYDTQGRQRAVTNGTSQWEVTSKVYISADMLSGDNLRRTDVWTRTGPVGSESGAHYQIMGVRRFDPADAYNPSAASISTVWRVWDSNIGWIDLTNPVASGWNEVKIRSTGTTYEYYLNGVLVHIDNTVNSYAITTVYLQAFNFSGSGQGYEVYWDDLEVALMPSTMNITMRPDAPNMEGTRGKGVAGDSPDAEWDFGSWQAQVPVTTPPSGFTTIILPPITLFGREVTVNQIASITYWTKKGTPQTEVDWFFQFYTKNYAGDPSAATWYGHRINAEPYFSDSLNAPANQWNQWVTDASTDNRLRFCDTTGNYFGGYTDPFLPGIIAQTYPVPAWNLNGAYLPLGPQEVFQFRLGLGTAWAGGFTGQIDGIRIELTDGSVANINLEPGTLTLKADQTCYDLGAGDTVTVQVEMEGIADAITGGQFFLKFDSDVLDYVGVATHSPLDTVITEDLNGDELDIAVGVDLVFPPPAGVSGTAILVDIIFEAKEEVCGANNLVTFRSHTPPTRLTRSLPTPGEVLPDLINLGSIAIDGTPPTIISPIPNITVPADAGLCTAVVSWSPPTATDNCTDDEDIAVNFTGLPPGSAFPQGPTSVSYSFTDACGNVAYNNFTVTVLDTSDMVVTVDIPGLNGTVTRCITFELSGPDSDTASAEMTFVGGSATATIQVPCGVYNCVVARDKLHTLARAQPLVDAGTQYTTSFTGSASLLSGNLNDDPYIDILDFGIFVFQFNQTIGANTTCTTPDPHSDLDGDGIVFTVDYTFIQGNFLKFSETCPMMMMLLAGGPVPADLAAVQGFGGPRSSISVRELQKMGLGHLAVADRNGDQVVDATDMALFLGGGMK